MDLACGCLPAEGADLVRKCLHVEPAKRPSCPDLVNLLTKAMC